MNAPRRSFKVICGTIEEVVEADSHKEAAERLFTGDYILAYDNPEIGRYVSTIEVVGEELWHPVEFVLARIKESGNDTAAPIAAKSSDANPESGG